MQLKSLEDTQNFSKNISKIISVGDIIFLYGEIGVGKTTLLRLISGSLPCSSGELKVLGSNSVRSGAHKRVATGMSYAPQENIVFDDLTV